MMLQNFLEEDLQEIVALHNRLFPPHKHWSFEEAKAQLTDLARNKGKNVIKAVSDNSLVGVAGWVSVKDCGEFYGAPFFATSCEAATALLADLLTHARNDSAKFIRVGAYPFKQNNLEALKNLNFRKSFEFVEMELSTSNAPNTKVSENLKFIPAQSVDTGKYRVLYNASFKGVSNAPAVTHVQAEELWKSSLMDTDLSGVWALDNNNYAAFIIVHKGGYIDSIGVDSSFQRKGLGVAIYENTFHKAHAKKLEKVHCTVASNNLASLNFHRKFGFSERGKRDIWEFVFSY